MTSMMEIGAMVEHHWCFSLTVPVYTSPQIYKSLIPLVTTKHLKILSSLITKPQHFSLSFLRSFSSLRLSLGASYLSHSVLSLAERRGSHHYDPSLASNQYSFCSRGSHFAIGSIRLVGSQKLTSKLRV